MAAGASGVFFAGLNAGEYYVSTANTAGYIDEVWGRVYCFGGSAFSGACNPKDGQIIEVQDGDVTDGIDFRLGLIEDLLFRDGFESGDVSFWSFQAGG